MSKILGIIGPRGSGKTAFTVEAASLVRGSVGIVRVSDVLRETLVLWGIAPTTTNMQLIAEKMRESFGTSVLADAVKSRIDSSHADVIFVEGIRGPNVLKVVREYPNSTLVYIDAPQDVRFARVSNRGEKVDEWRMDIKKFVELDTSPMEKALREFKGSADHHIDNTGSYESYFAAIKEYLTSLGVPTYEIL